jgi:hypothetical protein
MTFNQLHCFLLTTFILSLSSNAQTKLIAHKSHSGSIENFRIAYEGEFSDMDNSNLGMYIERDVRTASLDTLILVSDSVAVMVTSEYCSGKNTRSGSPTTKWRAGRDTVYNHPLFSKKNSISYIKSYLHQHYFFQNPTDSVKFIIQEEQQHQEQQEYQSVPAIGKSGGDDNSGDGNSPVIWLSLMVLFSVLTGIAYYTVSRFRKTF